MVSMDDQIKKRPGAPTDATAPRGRSSTFVREPQTRIKLLAMVVDGYCKIYSDHPASLHVVTVPNCDSAAEERQALELAESRVPLGWQHLLDERLLIGSLSTAVPTIQAMQEAEGIAFGLNVMDEAVRRSLASKKARAAG